MHFYLTRWQYLYMKNLSRRRCLRGTVTGGLGAVSGCLLSSSDSRTATASEGEKTEVGGEPIQELRVGQISGTDRSVPFTGSVSVVRQPAPQEAGVLEVTLRNEASEAWKVGKGRRELPFPITTSFGLFVDYRKSGERMDGCLRRHHIVDGVGDRERVKSGAEIRGRHYLITRKDANECLPGGEHHFSNGYNAVPADQDFADGNGFEWGFTLVLV
jgi:hypothetical protein